METTNPPATTPPPTQLVNLKRPWQATTLGVIDVVIAVFFLAAAIFVIFSFLRFANLFDSSPQSTDDGPENILEGFFTGLGIVAGMVTFLSTLLYGFMARAIFKGRRWSPILSAFLAIAGIIGQIVALRSGSDTSTIFLVLLLVFYVIVLYLAVRSFRDPFFHQQRG